MATHNEAQTTAHNDSPGGLPNYGAVTKVAMIALVVGAVVFGGCAVATFSSSEISKGLTSKGIMLSYLAGLVFWIDVALGAFSLTMLGYLTSASWGIVQRRIFQAIIRCWPLLFVLALPVIASLFISGGEYSPFWWTVETKQYTYVPEAQIEYDHKKHDWLNPQFFAIRAVVYFGLFGLYMWALNATARSAEDKNNESAKGRLRVLSGPGVAFWALLTTFLATDFVMSVEPTWSSTMFPVIFAVNGFLTAHCFGVFTFYSLNMKNREVMDVYLKEKFRLDMATLMLGFAMVWSYASFSQFMLIWAGNIPEEVTYYRKRGSHGWEFMSYLLILFHWLVPFVVLLFRDVKRHPGRMRVMCLILLAICMVDVVWWIIPSIPNTTLLNVPMAFGALAMIGGIFGLYFAFQLKKRGMISPEAQFLKDWGHHH